MTTDKDTEALIERLMGNQKRISVDSASSTCIHHSDPATALNKEAATALRAQQDRIKEFERDLDAFKETYKSRASLRAAAAEARVKELEAQLDEKRNSVKQHRKWLTEAQSRAGESLGRAMSAEAKLAEALNALKETIESYPSYEGIKKARTLMQKMEGGN